ncbi:MAG: HAMP domain-containing protein, partial [Alphaproteobacteria bacterium]
MPKNGTFGFLTNFRLAVQIGMLVVLALVGLAGITGVYIVSDARVGTAFEQQKSFLELEELTGEINVGALQLRRREKDFLLRKNMKYVGKHAKDMARVDKAMGHIAGIEAAAPIMDQVKALEKTIGLYAKQFATVVASRQEVGMSEKEGLEGKLRKAVKTAEGKLKKASLSKLTVKMLMMRRHEKDFMLRGDKKKYIGRIDKRRVEFNAILAASALPQADKKEITALMDAYQAGIHAYANSAVRLATETKGLSKLFAETGPFFKALFAFSKKGLEKSKAELNAARDVARTTILVVCAVVILAFLGLAFLLARSITSPINALTRAMATLAGGDTSVEVPSADNRDEVGDMARAVQVFKDSAIEKGRMEEERAVAEKKAEQEKRQGQLKLADDLEASVKEIVAAVASAATEMESTAQSMSANAEQSTRQSKT